MYHQKEKEKKTFLKISFCWHLEGQWRKLQDPDQLVRGMDPRIQMEDSDPHLDPDPLVRGMNPRIRIWIHTKISWIRNTG